MDASFIKFSLVTLLIGLGVVGGIYWIAGQGGSGRQSITTEQESHYIADAQLADSLVRQLKKTDPIEKASDFSTLRFQLQETIGRLGKGYGPDSLFTQITGTTGQNYQKLLDLIALQTTNRQNRITAKTQIKLQLDGLTTAVQALQTQVMLKQANLDNLRAMKASQRP
ncbi:hypothetical protein [Fibrella forsythiae]|uniref:Uncharacterized protein n=1 Tax=Fibrella forsythiae TaxID=2817061 RepID=A0ABS3JML3_9BACT|nr:hypothetical protein [Fibrella forsythiae]MBO0950444.1 hypothetical protein [Fibrella forsythiae]